MPAAARGQALPELPDAPDMTVVRGMATQYLGRWSPLDTTARAVVEHVTGQMAFRGHDPVRLLLAWHFDSAAWAEAPLVTIGNRALRRELGLDDGRRTYSFSELLRHPTVGPLLRAIHRKDPRTYDPLEREVADISSKLGVLQDAFRAEVIRIVPHPTDANGAWRSPTDQAVAEEWRAVGRAFLDNDAPAFDRAVGALLERLAALPAAHRPDPGDLELEVHINELQPYRIAFFIMAAGTVLAAISMLIGGLGRRIFSVATFVALLLGFGFITYGIGVRWHLAGRIPSANMYESMLFLSWGVGAFDLLAILVLRQPIVSFKSALMATGALALVNFVGLDWTLRPVAPALLDTVWMAIHVPVIMVSYSVLFDAFLIAHIQLIIMAAAPNRKELIQRVDQLHYWFVNIGSILLFVGIATGSMWGAYAWGRYWGWDPKEVWSLIAYLGYLAILHVRVDREKTPTWLKAGCVVLVLALLAKVLSLFHDIHADTGSFHYFVYSLPVAAAMILIFTVGRGGPLSTAVKSVLAAWLIGMAYVGVNYVLGTGLHSYGFGTGAIISWAMIIGTIDLSIMTVCIGAHVVRGRMAPRVAAGA